MIFGKQECGTINLQVAITLLFVGGVQPHRHSKIGLWGWGKMRKNGAIQKHAKSCQEETISPFIEFNQPSQLLRTPWKNQNVECHRFLNGISMVVIKDSSTKFFVQIGHHAHISKMDILCFAKNHFYFCIGFILQV